jgi:hypothetical protein
MTDTTTASAGSVVRPFRIEVSQGEIDELRSRRPGACQPIQGDVVDDVFPGQIARRLSVDEDAGDLLVAVGVVVDHPRRQRDG